MKCHITEDSFWKFMSRVSSMQWEFTHLLKSVNIYRENSLYSCHRHTHPEKHKNDLYCSPTAAITAVTTPHFFPETCYEQSLFPEEY